MDKPILKQIDILVYPSYGGNFELRTKEGAVKFKQWIKQIELAKKRNDTLFVVFPDSPRTPTVFSKRIKAELKKNLPSSHFFMNYDSNLDSILMEKDIIKLEAFIKNNFSLAPSILIKRYGQHAPDACIEAHGRKLSARLSGILKNEGLVLREIKANGLSVKFPENYFLKLARERVVSKPVGHMTEQEIRMILRTLVARKRMNPSKIAHSITRSKTMEQVAQNLKGLLPKTRMRK